MAALPRLSSNISGDCRVLFSLHFTEAGNVPVDGGPSCAGARPPRRDESRAKPLADVLPADDSPDSVESELLAMGKRGREVLATRNEVLSVLQGNTGCSAWYLSKDPDAVAMFRSLHMALDEHDPGLVRKILLPQHELLYVQPYVARAQQFVGPGSTITVNEHGAFFEDARGVVLVREEGGPATYEPARMLRVGVYRGGTEEARVLTLLHEFGHVIDLLPLDAGVPDGPEISMHNTDLVLDHCKADLEAVSRVPRKKPSPSQTLLRASSHP